MPVLISKLFRHATGSKGAEQVVLLFTWPPPKIKDPILKNVPHQWNTWYSAYGVPSKMNTDAAKSKIHISTKALPSPVPIPKLSVQSSLCLAGVSWSRLESKVTRPPLMSKSGKTQVGL
jgi:hypothetical protein